MQTLKKTIESTAIVSDNRLYRYYLTRTWEKEKKKATVIMLNPSKANELKTDKTVMNVMNYLIDNDFGSVSIVNLFSCIATNPKDLGCRNEQFELDNDQYILEAFDEADIIIVGWTRSKAKFIKERINVVEEKLIHYKNKTKCFVDGTGKKMRHPRDMGVDWTLDDYEFKTKDKGNIK